MTDNGTWRRRSEQRADARSGGRVEQAGGDINHTYNGPVINTTHATSGRSRTAVLVTAGIVVVMVVGAFIWAGRGNTSDGGAGAAPSPSATKPSPSPTASCFGASCTGVPPTTTVCQNDVVTAYTGRGHGVLVELRYSARCRAAWAKMKGSATADVIRVTGKDGDMAEYQQQGGRDAHTDMVEAQQPGDATACAALVGQGMVCATASAAPQPTPRP